MHIEHGDYVASGKMKMSSFGYNSLSFRHFTRTLMFMYSLTSFCHAGVSLSKFDCS